MKTLKLFIGIIFIISFSNLSKAEVKKDCSMIKNDTISGNLKYIMCKRGSDKLDKDGNFKKGTFNILKKLKIN